MKTLTLDEMLRATKLDTLSEQLDFAVNNAEEFDEIPLILSASYGYVDKDIEELLKYTDPSTPRAAPYFGFVAEIASLKARDPVPHTEILKFVLHHFEIKEAATAAVRLFELPAIDARMINSCCKSLLLARNLLTGTVVAATPKKPAKRKTTDKTKDIPVQILEDPKNFAQVFIPGVFSSLRGNNVAVRVLDKNGIFNRWLTPHPDVTEFDDSHAFGFVANSGPKFWAGKWQGMLGGECRRLTKRGIKYAIVDLESGSKKLIHLPDGWDQEK